MAADRDRGPRSKSAAGKAAWTPIRLDYVGRVDEVIRQGGGKITVVAGDPGEPRKQQPIG
jgi:hypothetical protein